MDHVVYIDAQSRELDQLRSGRKTMIIRGAAGRKMPHGRVKPGDVLYFINNNSRGVVCARGIAKSVFNSSRLSIQESIALVSLNQERLQLSNQQFRRWAGKRYLVLIEVDNFTELEPFPIDRSQYGDMDDWLPVGDIRRVRVAPPPPPSNGSRCPSHPPGPESGSKKTAGPRSGLRETGDREPGV